MSRVPRWTKAAIITGILLLAGIVVWRLPSTARPPVELTFVRYEYDAIVLRLINRTSSRLIVISPSTTNVSFNAFMQQVEARSELELCRTTRTRWTP